MPKQRTKNYATNKRKHRIDVNGKFNLKKTREDSKKYNYNCVVHKPNPNIKQNISKISKEPTISNTENR